MREAVDAACEPFQGRITVTAADLDTALRRSGKESEPGQVYAHLLRRLRLTGGSEVSVADVAEVAQLQAHARRAYRTTWDASGRRAMTVHGAKNREFDNVFVHWPYEAFGEPEVRRRLLYNAVTRARLHAIVIVQGEGRVDGDPALKCLAG